MSAADTLSLDLTVSADPAEAVSAALEEALARVLDEILAAAVSAGVIADLSLTAILSVA